MSFYSAHRCSDISVHTSPPRAVSCCLKVSSSCSLTSSCWLFLSRSVSRERILCNQHHMPRRNYKASKAQSDRFWRQPKKSSTRQTGQALLFTSSSLLLSELGGLTCRLVTSSIFLLRWAFSCLSLSSSASALETELLDLKPSLATRFSLAPLEVMAASLVPPRRKTSTKKRKLHQENHGDTVEYTDRSLHV